MDGSEKLRAAEVCQQLERGPPKAPRSHEAQLRRAHVVLAVDMMAALDIRPPELAIFPADPG